jgi:hypothetical protein
MGRTFVNLVIEMERTMDAVRHVYPATDHLARRPSPVTAESARALAEALKLSSREVVDLFERWRHLCDEFFGVAAELNTLQDGSRASRSPHDQATYTTRLDGYIARVHALRRELVELSQELQRAVVAELDRRLA